MEDHPSVLISNCLRCRLCSTISLAESGGFHENHFSFPAHRHVPLSLPPAESVLAPLESARISVYERRSAPVVSRARHSQTDSRNLPVPARGRRDRRRAHDARDRAAHRLVDRGPRRPHLVEVRDQEHSVLDRDPEDRDEAGREHLVECVDIGGDARDQPAPEYHGGEARFRTLDEYRQLMRDIVRQGERELTLRSMGRLSGPGENLGEIVLAVQEGKVIRLRDVAVVRLSGVPLHQAIETPPPLSTDRKEESNRLLEAVIANWPALKNTSPDGLRGTFLQREGALRPKDDNWHLLLTRTGFDVLMDRLPWTISTIQLPWMPWLLRTDWAD